MAAECGKKFIALSRTVDGLHEYRSFPLRCKSWNCPICATKKSIRIGKRISHGFKNQQLYFYTLTFYHSKDTITAWKEAAAAWNNLNIAIHKKYGKFSYVKILESHNKSCYPHYHLLSEKLFEASWFGKAAIAAGFGYQLRVQRVNSAGVNGYMRKYLGKSWPREDAKKIRTELRLRVVTYSRNFPFLHVSENPWIFERISYTVEGILHTFSMVMYGNQFKEMYFNKEGLGAPFPSFRFFEVKHPHTNELNWKERLLCNCH